MRRLTVLLAALSVAGCSLFRSDPKPKIAPLPEIKSPLAVRTLWSLELGTAGASTLTPAIADKAVFAAARDGSVVRVDAASGKVLWRTATGIVITGGVGADGETVVVGSNEGEVVALDAGTGIPRWRARVSSEVLAPPAVSGDVVVVRCSDSRMFALEARDGRRR